MYCPKNHLRIHYWSLLSSQSVNTRHNPHNPSQSNQSNNASFRHNLHNYNIPTRQPFQTSSPRQPFQYPKTKIYWAKAHVQLRLTFCKILSTLQSQRQSNASFELFSYRFLFNLHWFKTPLIHKNMKSADVHSSELPAIINKEIHLGRMARPFDNPPMFNLRCNPVGVLPKRMGWRLITNVSAPIGNNVTDFIDPALSSVSILCVL